MRQLLIRVPRRCGDRIEELAREVDAINLTRLEGTVESTDVALLIAHVSNARVGALLDSLEALPDVHVSFAPQGVLALRPPSDQAVDQGSDVAPRSPLEILLSSLVLRRDGFDVRPAVVVQTVP